MKGFKLKRTKAGVFAISAAIMLLVIGGAVVEIFRPRLGDAGTDRAGIIIVATVLAAAVVLFALSLFLLKRVIKTSDGRFEMNAASEEHFRRAEKEQKKAAAVLEAMIDGVTIMNMDGKIIDINEAACRQLGYAREETIGKDARDVLVSGRHVTHLVEQMRKLVQGESIEASEYYLKHKNGKEFPASISLSVLWDSDDNPRGVVAVHRDARERKQREKNLRASEERFRSLTASSPIAMFQTDMQGRVTYASPKWQALSGQSFEVSLGEGWQNVVHPEDRRELLDVWLGAAREGREFSMEHRIITEQGDLRWTHSRAAAMRSDSGALIGYVGTVEDITERKEAEGELKKNAYYIDALGDALFVMDLEGRMLKVNKAASEISGYTTEELLAMKHSELVPQEAVEEHLVEMEKLAEMGPTMSIESYVLTKEKARIPVIISGTVVTDARGRPIAFVAVIKDITERKEAEKRINQARDKAESVSKKHEEKVVALKESRTAMLNMMQDMEEAKNEAEKLKMKAEATNSQLEGAMERTNQMALAAESANKVKSEFLANVSHEIRTPMNGVMGMIELAMETEGKDERREFLAAAKESADSLMTVINDILDFSKMEAGKLALETIDFDLRSVVEGAVDSLVHKAEERDLELACLIHHDVPSALCGDPGRVRQVLINLIGNAVKFTEKGEVVIRVQMEKMDNESAKIHFSITDTGIGIPSDEQVNIFEKFAQADGSTTRKYGGTGLGLSICRQIVEMMGGEIGVESEEGKGSKFWFTAVFGLQDEQQAQPEWQMPEIRGVRVLIVDDNETNRTILTRMLESFECRPHAVSSGSEAVEILKKNAGSENEFKIVLLDIHMPEKDGEQVTREILSNPKTRNVDIIILTSAGRRGDVPRFKKIGCAGYLLKPVKQSQLFDTLVTVMGIAKTGSERHTTRIVTRHNTTEIRQAQKYRLLLVEDNPINQKLAVKVLEKAGYHCVVANNGQEAVNALSEKHYDLVLMDIQMPVMNGFEATHAIREREGDEHHTPVIAMTAHAMKGDREKCIRAGMDDYLSKPLKREVVLEVIKKWLEPGGKKPESAVKKKSPPAFPRRRSPIEFDSALERVGGDKEFLIDLIETFLEYVPETIESLKKADRNGEADNIIRTAHGIKGAAHNLSAGRVALLAEKIERLGKADDISSVSVLLEEMETEVRRIEKYLGAIRKEAEDKN